MARDEPAEAASSYRSAIDLGLRSPTMFFDLGIALAQAGRAEPAIDALRQALDAAPEGALLHSWYASLAAQLLEVRRYPEALEAYRRAEYPGSDEDAELWQGRAKALAGLLRLTEALEAIEQAVRLDPYSAAIALDYASVLESAGRADESLVELERAVELEPEQGRFHYELGVALEDRGEGERARHHIERAERLGYVP